MARGHYRILLGMAAGVGKTYRMLQEGGRRRRRAAMSSSATSSRTTAPRPLRSPTGSRSCRACAQRTAASSWRSWTSTPSSRRAPELALIDELAHTNAPGLRNEKRYQDIDEVLAAGIDVISTVNVQHLESLNDRSSS